MNIDVKNALNNLLIISKSVDSGLVKLGKRINFVEVVVSDIFAFINFISNEKGERRVTYFNKVYLHGDYKIEIKSIGDCEIPEAIQLLLRSNLPTVIINKYLAVYYLFTSTLAKAYQARSTDRKDISNERIVVYHDQLSKIKQDFIDTDKEIKEKNTMPYPNGNGNIPQDDKTDSAVSKSTADKSADSEQDSAGMDTVGIDSTEPEESLEELMNQLNNLTGLAGVKNDVESLINYLKINNLRKARGKAAPEISKHLVFLGNPGTGKTTVARLIAKIYKKIGALEKGQLVEVDRGGLVAGYVGQTAKLTNSKIEEAMGGVLFIDEAYTLAKEGNDFGQEAIDTILKAMEDKRDQFVVIVAGYPEPMQHFLASNPGLKSRFNKTIIFEDYNSNELYQIFEGICRKNDLVLGENVQKTLISYLEQLCNNKPENFANGREMRNLFELTYGNQANRLAKITGNITDEELSEIRLEDLPGYIINF